jgi:hypothetical protein
MQVRMDIHASVDGADVRGIFKVWIVERRLYRAFRFRFYNYKQKYHRFEVTHNDEGFLDLQVSDDPDDEVANKQAEGLSLGQSLLIALMLTLLNKVLDDLEGPEVQIGKEQGMWALVGKCLNCNYDSPAECEAISTELFALPDTVIAEVESGPAITH